MTTNQTINGVPGLRSLIERVTSQDLGMSAKKDRAQAAHELRALLDAPAHVHEWDINAEGTATVCHCGARSSDEPSTNPQDKASLLDPYDGGTFVESTPNGCENCAMDLSTCDCVEPKPVRWTYSPSRGSKSTPQGEPVAFQDRVKPWMLECFGEVIAADSQERNHRFLEEALELVQACGCTATEAHQLVEYVYGRPVGEPSQEVGGVMVTLAALCLAHGLDMHASGETELARIWTKVEQIRAKQAAKPAMSPLPGAYPDREQPAPLAVADTRTPFEIEHDAEPGDEAAFRQWRQERLNSTRPAHTNPPPGTELFPVEPAAQPQGEPVCEVIAAERGSRTLLWIADQLPNIGTKLYAEQPAPVAVVLPEQLIAAIEAEQSRLSEEDYLMDSEDCVKVIREEVTRLNSTRPTHANPPPGNEPSGTHHDNDGLDDYRVMGLKVVEDASVPPGQVRMCNCNRECKP